MTVRRWLIRPVTVLLGVLTLPACRIQENPRPTRATQADVAREQIASTLTSYRDALMEGDANAAADAFATDGILSEPGAADAVGTDAIRAALRRRFAHAAVTDMFMDRDPVHVADGGVAFEMGTFEETLQIAEQPPTTQRGRYAITWRRLPEAEWRIQQMLYNFYPADTTAAR